VNTRLPSKSSDAASTETAADKRKTAATAAGERALGWDEVGIDSPDFAQLSAPESSSLLTADIGEATGSLPGSDPWSEPAKKGILRPGQPVVGSLVELLVKGCANAVWAVVGLVLWIPLLLRTLLLSVLGVIHGALTGQNALTVPIRIREASRFYTSQFLTGEGGDQKAGLRRRLRPTRLLFEVLWASVFYALILALAGVIELPLDDGRQAMSSFWSQSRSFLSEQAASWGSWIGAAWNRAPADLQAILKFGPIVWAVLALMGIGCLTLGWFIGSRSRH